MAAALESLRLPSIPEGWSAEQDFKPLGKLLPATPRNIEPIGAHFLAEARRVRDSTPNLNEAFTDMTTAVKKRHKRTFSEDERIQAQENVKKTEDDDAGEISEPEDPLMLQRDAKEWKVRRGRHFCTPQPIKVYIFYGVSRIFIFK